MYSYDITFTVIGEHTLQKPDIKIDPLASIGSLKQVNNLFNNTKTFFEKSDLGKGAVGVAKDVGTWVASSLNAVNIKMNPNDPTAGEFAKNIIDGTISASVKVYEISKQVNQVESALYRKDYGTALSATLTSSKEVGKSVPLINNAVSFAVSTGTIEIQEAQKLRQAIVCTNALLVHADKQLDKTVEDKINKQKITFLDSGCASTIPKG